MCLGFTVFCFVCVFRPEYLASTYFIREKYGPKVTLLFRVLALLFGLGGVRIAIDTYRNSPFGQQPNLIVSSFIGLVIATFFILFVKWGRERRLRQRSKQN